HHRGFQSLRHHLGHDARRTRQQYAHAVDPRLSGSVFLPAGRVRRIAGPDRHASGDGAGHRLFHIVAKDCGECHLMERRSQLFTVFIYLSALLLAAVILAPVAWLFIMSISPAADLAAKPLRWWPQQMDFSRYQLLLSTIEN